MRNVSGRGKGKRRCGGRRSARVWGCAPLDESAGPPTAERTGVTSSSSVMTAAQARDSRYSSDTDVRTENKRLLCVVCVGSRLVMRAYAGTKERRSLRIPPPQPEASTKNPSSRKKRRPREQAIRGLACQPIFQGSYACSSYREVDTHLSLIKCAHVFDTRVAAVSLVTLVLPFACYLVGRTRCTWMLFVSPKR